MSLLSQLIILLMLVFAVLFPLYLMLFMMRRSRRFTMARHKDCKEEHCTTQRIKRPSWLKALDPLVKTRQFKCKQCNREFIRLKP